MEYKRNVHIWRGDIEAFEIPFDSLCVENVILYPHQLH